MSKDRSLSDRLYSPSIDSFKLRFPIDLISIIDERIYEHQTKYTIADSTGEIRNEEKIQNNSFKYHFIDYHIHFRLEDIFGSKHVAILINSKLLESDYRQGIHEGNIRQIYDKIQSCNVLDLTFSQFMQGIVSDLDIKKDVVLSASLFRKAIPEFKRKTIPQKHQGEGVLSFTQLNNLGIQWNSREHSSPTKPFLKFYHKGIEAIYSKNKGFFEQYIDVNELSDIVRIETTIKNKKHLQKHGIQGNTLKEVIEISQQKLDSIIRHSVTSNLHQRIQIVKPRNQANLSPSDTTLFALMSHVIKSNGMSIDEVINYVLSHHENKTYRHREKARLKRIYSEQIESEKYANNNKKITSFFRSIGWQ
jgi:hypothetical protein